MAFKCRFCGSKQAANDEQERCIRCEIMYGCIKENPAAAEKILEYLEFKKGRGYFSLGLSTNNGKH